MPPAQLKRQQPDQSGVTVSLMYLSLILYMNLRCRTHIVKGVTEDTIVR